MNDEEFRRRFLSNYTTATTGFSENYTTDREGTLIDYINLRRRSKVRILLYECNNCGEPADGKLCDKCQAKVDSCYD